MHNGFDDPWEENDDGDQQKSFYDNFYPKSDSSKEPENKENEVEIESEIDEGVEPTSPVHDALSSHIRGRPGA